MHNTQCLVLLGDRGIETAQHVALLAAICLLYDVTFDCLSARCVLTSDISFVT